MRTAYKIITRVTLLLLFLSITLSRHAYAGPCAQDPATSRYLVPTAPGGCCVIPAGGGTLDTCASGNMPRMNPPGSLDCVCTPASEELKQLFVIVNNIMIPLTIIAGLFIIVLAGYKILTSQGNPQELETGKENLTSAIIGLIFVLMAVSILRVIIKALITGNQDPF